MLKCLLTAAALLACALAQGAEPPSANVRLYTLDCGRIDFDDMRVFSDTGDHDGERGIMPVTCFLIRHAQTWMLWDAGLGDEIATKPDGEMLVGLHFRVPVTLRSQLAALGLTTDDVRLVGLSHLHADHSGNAALFPHATFLVSPAELAWAGTAVPPEGVLADRVAAVKAAKVQPVAGDLDVFGDGSVRMIATPGHTPGHHSLVVRLGHAGVVILSGDVAHFRENYDKGLVPLGNASRAETLASIDRVRGLARHLHARVVIQHAQDVFTSMPKLPAFLD